jgi:hypothetical protein
MGGRVFRTEVRPMKRKVARTGAVSRSPLRVLERRSAALKMAAVGAGAAGAVALVKLKRSRTGKIQEAVQYLRTQLGAGTTAYLSGEDDAQIVDLWIEGRVQPDKLRWKRLLSAYAATRCLVDAYDDHTARSWFLGMNPTLDDQAPARVLRNSRGSRVLDDVVLAAREFAET